jgi:outer membrane protein assembly factor BamB
MLPSSLVLVVAIVGLACAALAGVIALLAKDRRRKVAVASVAVVLAVLSLVAVIWIPASAGSRRLLQPVPVDDAATLYYSGQDCNGVAFILLSPCESDRALYAVRVRDGTVRWRHPTPGPTYFDWSSPVLHGGVLYVSSANSQAQDGGYVAAIRASNGSEIWHIERPTLGALKVFGESLVVVGYKELDVLRLSDGAVVRTMPLPSGDATLALDESIAYRCQSDGTLVALRLSDLHPLWRTVVDAAAATTSSSALVCVSTVQDSVVYVQTPAPSYLNEHVDSSLVAVRASDGQVLWRYHVGPAAALTISGGMLFTIQYGATSTNQYGVQVPSEPDTLLALRARDGSLVWQRSLGIVTRKTGALTAMGNAVYVGALGSLLALRLSDGGLLWQRKDNSNRSLSAAAMLDDVVFVQSTFVGSGSAFANGFPRPYLLALRPSDGALYWQTAVDVLGSLEVGAGTP